MARPREFDLDEAVTKAMGVFWEKGYEGASLPDLLDGMGIARGSLYKAFGDKKRLFMETLTCYDETIVGPAIRFLEDGQPEEGGARLAALFDQVIAAARDGDRRGCLLCNVAAGPAAHDTDIGQAVGAMMERLTRAFAGALADARVLSAQSDGVRRARARALVASYVGLRVLAKAGESVPVLEETVRACLADLRPAPVASV